MANHDNEHVGFVPDPNNGRGTIGILWLCLPTIFLCTYTVLHLDVPLFRLSTTEAFKRKAKWTIGNILCPEYTLMRAIQQHTIMRDVLDRCHKAQKADAQAVGASDNVGQPLMLSKAQVWYVISAGIRRAAPEDRTGWELFHLEEWLANPEHRKLVFKGIPDHEEIEDRSKTDSLGRFIACTQASWLVVTVIARLVNHMDVSLLEVLTVGYVVLALATWSLWWHKPYDVRTYTLLEVPDDTKHRPPRDRSLEELDFTQTGQNVSIVPPDDTSSRPVKTLTPPTHASLDVSDDARSGPPSDIPLKGLNPVQIGQNLPIVPPGEFSPPPVKFSTLPTRTSLHAAGNEDSGPPRDGPLEEINYVQAERASLTMRPDSSPFGPEVNGVPFVALFLYLPLCIVTLGFGAIHIAAWNYQFATFPEAVLWRVSALTIGVSPCVLILLIFIPVGPITKYISITFGVIMVVMYLLARIYIIIETFLAFRSAPVGIYEQVQWSSYFGHLGA